MLLRTVLSAQAARVSRALAMRSGVEMRAARRAAERIGAQIVLGECPASLSNSCQVGSEEDFGVQVDATRACWALAPCEGPRVSLRILFDLFCDHLQATDPLRSPCRGPGRR